MSKEIRIIAWCDGPHEQKVKAMVDHTNALDGGKPHEFDVCEDCETNIVAPLRALMANGSVVKDTTKPAKEYPCPLCEDVLPTAQSRGRHVKSAHDTTMAELDKQ